MKREGIEGDRNETEGLMRRVRRALRRMAPPTERPQILTHGRGEGVGTARRGDRYWERSASSLDSPARDSRRFMVEEREALYDFPARAAARCVIEHRARRPAGSSKLTTWLTPSLSMPRAAMSGKRKKKRAYIDVRGEGGKGEIERQMDIVKWIEAEFVMNE